MVNTLPSADADNGSSRTIHFPSLSAVAVFPRPANLTVTLAPGSAHPQIGTGHPCCNTILSAITAGSFTSPLAGQVSAMRRTPDAERTRLTMVCPLLVRRRLFKQDDSRLALDMLSRILRLQFQTSARGSAIVSRHAPAKL